MKEKMRFEEFKVAVVDGIREWLPEQFATAHVSLQVVTKNNDLQLTGLTIQSVGSNVSPTIYLESFYEKYQEGIEMPDILRRIAEVRMEYEVEGDFEVSQITDFDNCKDKILPRLIGAEWNQTLLEKRPHIIIEDLAVTFYIDLGKHNDGSMSVPIHNDLMNTWGVTTDDLFEIAVKNLSDSKAGTFRSINEVMASMMLPNIIDECGGNEEAAKEMLEMMMPPEDKMYVLSNKDGLNGASILLDKQMMQSVIDRVGSDFYILPSSIHECLVVPASQDMEPDDLVAMVREVNSTTVSNEDRLSNSIYTYSIEEGIKLA